MRGEPREEFGVLKGEEMLLDGVRIGVVAGPALRRVGWSIEAKSGVPAPGVEAVYQFIGR